MKQLCGNGTASTSYLIDSKREYDIGIGRDWDKKDEAIPIGTIYISKAFKETAKYKEDEIIYVKINLQAIFLGLWNHTVDQFLHSDEGEPFLYPTDNIIGTVDPDSDTTPTTSSGYVQLWKYVIAPFKIGYIFHDSGGKIGVTDDPVVFFEYGTFLLNFEDYFHPTMPDTLKKQIVDWNLYDYAQELLINLPNDDNQRMDTYTTTSMDAINQNLIDYSSDIAYELGFEQIHTVLPILYQLNQLEIFNLFLGLILHIITFILLFLSILLIYSLLMVSVESKTYEIGILRMIGMSRLGIVELLIIQSFLYALPAWILGIIFAEVLGFFLNIYFVKLTNIPIDGNVTPKAIAVATFIAFFIPIFSSIFPIKFALQKNLSDSLNYHRNASNQASPVKVTIERSSDGGVSFLLLFSGCFLFLFGFSIYYLIPLSLLSMQLNLLLNLFFAILILMLFGLVLFSLNFQRILEFLIIYLLFWWEKKAVKSVILKNLIAHRIRNKKTTIMYAVSLGFIIFIYVSYDVQIKSIIYQEQAFSGTYINVYAPVWSFIDEPYHIDILPALESWSKSNPFVISYAFVSHSILSFLLLPPLFLSFDSFLTSLLLLFQFLFSHSQRDFSSIYSLIYCPSPSPFSLLPFLLPVPPFYFSPSR